MSPVVDAQSGTVKVTLSIPRNQGLVPGMYVEVELVVAREDDALLVPKRALVYDDVQSFVYRLEPMTKEEIREFQAAAKAAEEAREEERDKDDEAKAKKASPPPDGVVSRLLVDPMLADRNHIVPSPAAGLATGDQIVVAGQAGLKDGAKVRIVEGVAFDAGPGGDPLASREGDTP